MNLKPIAGRVIVRAVELPEETIGGIVLPQSARKVENQGTVVAIGNGEPVFPSIDIAPGTISEIPDTMRLASPVAVGDHIAFDQNRGTQITYKGEDFIVVHVDDILAVLI